MRAGDHVMHRPTGETWTVAYVDGDYLAWCGWPEGEARLADCTLVYSCTDEQHVDLLIEMSRADAGKRTRKALEAIRDYAEVKLFAAKMSPPVFVPVAEEARG